eukprot:comp23391_c0_seq1/m.38759 comp23391_c0_seq1/g.38759  ORF comp23391_c0_seq1/g.38759 comp23391_c0_seq1/m.38759 type:complete len:288 (-) comp23391_c0_seq1:343-1206(-)
MVKVGIIGGTGLDNPDIFTERSEKFVDTPFGKPSDALILGKIKGVDCVLLARHDREHTITPTNINFRANIWALKQEGVDVIIASTACGSLREQIAPGHLVILDQGIDRTTKRHSTFYDNSPEGPRGICHIPMAEPFDPQVRNLLIEVAKDLGITAHPTGTMVAIEGPRFSTRAESKMFRAWGGDVINMTTFPEVTLAAEAGIPYASIAMATDYDCWHDTEEHVSIQLVLQTMKKNTENVKAMFLEAVPRLAKAEWAQAAVQAAKDKQANAILMPKGIETALAAMESQ